MLVFKVPYKSKIEVLILIFDILTITFCASQDIFSEISENAQLIEIGNIFSRSRRYFPRPKIVMPSCPPYVRIMRKEFNNGGDFTLSTLSFFPNSPNNFDQITFSNLQEGQFEDEIGGSLIENDENIENSKTPTINEEETEQQVKSFDIPEGISRSGRTFDFSQPEKSQTISTDQQEITKTNFTKDEKIAIKKDFENLDKKPAKDEMKGNMAKIETRNSELNKKGPLSVGTIARGLFQNILTMAKEKTKVISSTFTKLASNLISLQKGAEQATKNMQNSKLLPIYQ